MKALLKQQARPGLWLEDLPEPEVGVNDVLIKVLRTAVCGRCRNCLAGGAMGPAKWYLTGTNRGT